jgi:hypothetical protein
LGGLCPGIDPVGLLYDLGLDLSLGVGSFRNFLFVFFFGIPITLVAMVTNLNPRGGIDRPCGCIPF